MLARVRSSFDVKDNMSLRRLLSSPSLIWSAYFWPKVRSFDYYVMKFWLWKLSFKNIKLYICDFLATVYSRSLHTEPGDLTYFQRYDNKVECISDNAKQKKQNHPTLHAFATIYLCADELHINPCFRQHTYQRGRWTERYWSEPGGSKAKSNWKRFCVQRIRKHECDCSQTGWASIVTNWMQREKCRTILPTNAFCHSQCRFQHG